MGMDVEERASPILIQFCRRQIGPDVFVCRYDRRFGMGSIIRWMFPYSMIFLFVWALLFYLWVFVFQLPIGPNTPIMLEPAAGNI